MSKTVGAKGQSVGQPVKQPAALKGVRIKGKPAMDKKTYGKK